MTPDGQPGPTATLQDLQPNSDFGPYRIRRLLGRGGMGAVYEAEHRSEGRVVALKLLSVDLDKMDSRERFLREGETAAAISHPNAVYIYGTEEIEGTPAITMELVPGGTLDEKVKERGALPWAEAVEDILQVIDGLDAALIAGVLHRDVKPSNCFVGDAGAIKIGDFGLSKPVDSEEQQKLTKTGLFLGTPVFSSPEQLLGESLDVRSDIYAVGVTFYFLLTGQLPYHSGSMMQVVAAVLNGAPAPLTKYRTDLPQPVIDVVMKSMARKAEDRYQSYDEFRAVVAALRVVEVAPATVWDRFRAGFVDFLINAALLWTFSWIFLRNTAAAFDASRNANSITQLAISLAFMFVVVGIPEGLRGRSVGKWIVGIMVIGPDGQVPGILRSFARVLLYCATDYAAFGVRTASGDPNAQAGLILLAEVMVKLLLVSSARRSNGWRQLHDFATGTRVVMPRAMTVQRRGEAQRAAAPAMIGNELRVGPYVVLGPLRENSAIMRGWDGAMKRAVWIIPREAGSPEVSPARRSLSRLTRMRWVGGRRSVNDSWDAFEAPVGEPLTSRLSRAVPWRVQQDWLQDVATELIAAKKDGTLLAEITPDDLWVTPTDRIVFGELERVQTSRSEPSSDADSLIANLIARLNLASIPGAPLPRHAVRTLAAAQAAPSASSVLSLVHGSIGKPMTISRMRRGGLIAATVAPMVVFSFAGWFSMRQGLQMDRTGFIMDGLLSFATDSSSTNPDSVAVAVAARESDPRGSKRLGYALEQLGVLTSNTPDTITPADTLRRQRKLAEVYLATTLSARANDSTFKSMFGNTPKQQRRRAQILARNKQVDSATAREARFLVDSVWKQNVPGNGADTVLKFIPFAISIFFLCFGALVSLAATLFARRGPLMRGFQIDVVTSSGQPAGRIRLLVRTIANWSVLLVPIVVILISPMMSIGTLATLIVVAAAVCVFGWLGAITWSVRNPERALAERLSGTYLVPD